MKTLKQFEKQDEGFDQFLKPLDRIDYALYEHISCGYVASNFSDARWAQNGECSDEQNGIRYYETVMAIGDKYYYLGECPSMNPHVYERSQDSYSQDYLDYLDGMGKSML